jgi:glycosyltransferase involved in cell wall biosynthesis
MDAPRYCLLTACRNEVKYIAATMQSVLRQTTPPTKWIILDDGSTDGTAEVVKELSAGHEWITLRQLERRPGRSFGGQYRAIMGGYESIRKQGFDFVGALDADITFESAQYYERLFKEFARNPKLGIAGGAIYELEKGVFKARRGNATWSVAGGIQLFRREAFEAIGGYTPLEYGGSDGLAVLMAKMKGWEVRSFDDLEVQHHRPTSSADGQLRGAFNRGRCEAAFGYHPLFAMFKCARRFSFRPLILGSLMSLAGFLTYKAKGGTPVIPQDALSFLRRTQRERMFRALGLKGFGGGLSQEL